MGVNLKDKNNSWCNFKYNVRVLVRPDDNYRPIMRDMFVNGQKKFIDFKNCTIENINGYGIGMVWFTTEDGALLYVSWDMIVNIFPVKED